MNPDSAKKLSWQTLLVLVTTQLTVFCQGTCQRRVSWKLGRKRGASNQSESLRDHRLNVAVKTWGYIYIYIQGGAPPPPVIHGL